MSLINGCLSNWRQSINTGNKMLRQFRLIIWTLFPCRFFFFSDEIFCDYFVKKLNEKLALWFTWDLKLYLSKRRNNPERRKRPHYSYKSNYTESIEQLTGFYTSLRWFYGLMVFWGKYTYLYFKALVSSDQRGFYKAQKNIIYLLQKAAAFLLASYVFYRGIN